MEQAVNQFNKGLLSDTHPMVLGNDTLSDALNATFVTMNGNEVVLLNDMGNRRVDNAFLPSGFEPVGIKEYGGIIYVASYNPITNRSLIGSFPSPERKINSLDDKSLGNTFNFFDAFYNESDLDNKTPERRFITTDTVMLPLTGDISLHAGDKFIIYSDEIKYWEKYLSNYNYTFGNKILSPKNRHLTLSIGVLNSQNLFVDITKTLKRWKNGKIVKYDNSVSDEYIFNDGYFINDSSFEGDSSQYTIDDRQLIKERQTKPANTYAYKLTGPLYLKALLNHIQEFSFNISGDRDIPDNNIRLVITADIIYNCPDGSGNGNFYNENYLWDGCGEISIWEIYSSKRKCPFDFYYKKDGKYKKILLRNSVYLYLNNTITYSTPVYINNSYKVTAIMELNIVDIDDINGTLEYFVGVDAGIPLLYTPENEPYYIETLSQYGTLDLSKLNSGEIELKAFRFFNSNRSTTLTYVIDAYPKKEQIFKKVLFNLQDVENSSNSIMVEKNDLGVFPANNGKSIISFNWDINNIESGKLYKVVILAEDSTYGLKTIGTRWLLTTELFNDCYNPHSSEFVEDYLQKVYDPNGESYSLFLEYADLAKINYNNILYNKLKIDFTISLNEISNNVKTNERIEGKLIKKTTDSKIKYKTINNYIINRRIDDYMEIKNRELYPNSLFLNSNILELETKKRENSRPVADFDLSDIKISKMSNGTLSEIKQGNINGSAFKFNDSEYLLTYYRLGPIVANEININITCNNIVEAKSTNNKSVKNGFCKIHSEHFRKVLDSSTSHSGFFVANYDRIGSDDDHLIGLVIDHQYVSTHMKDSADMENAADYHNSPNNDDDWHVNFGNEYVERMYNNMSQIDAKNTFAYIFSSINIVGRPEDNNPRQLAYVSDLSAHGWAGFRNDSSRIYMEAGFCPITCCKVWWRNGINDYWVLLNNDNGGMFGGSKNFESMFCDKMLDSSKNPRFTYIGKDNWNNTYYNVLRSINENYYDKIYFGNDYQCEIVESSSNPEVRYNYISNINKKVLNQIMHFLDPDDKVVYNIYRQTNLSEFGLKTLSSENYSYNLSYSGDIIIKVDYKLPDLTSILNVNERIFNILPFYSGEVEDIEKGHSISIFVKSYDNFEDDIRYILDNSIIENIYLEDGSLRDKDENLLYGDVIYKTNEDGKLEAIENPPYKIYSTGNYNSLVSTLNYNSPSSAPSRYLRAYGDDGDVETSLEFSGGFLRSVDYTKFQNL